MRLGLDHLTRRAPRRAMGFLEGFQRMAGAWCLAWSAPAASASSAARIRLWLVRRWR